MNSVVFKTFWKVMNKYKGMVITYTAFLIFFSTFNFKSGNNTTEFVDSKPDILIVNSDTKEGVTGNLIKYLKKNCNVKKVKNNYNADDLNDDKVDKDEAVNDALFYRDVNYVIYIPKDYRTDFLNKHDPQIKIKTTGDYSASLANMILERYVKVANVYNDADLSEDTIIKCINDTLAKKTKVKVTSKLDTNKLNRATSYFNFTNYCTLAGCIYVICLVLSSFRNKKISKRTTISGLDYKKYNMQLMIANSIFALALWLVYVILGCILMGKIMFSVYGVVYMVNSLVFSVCSLTLAFLIANLSSNKEVINGIVNVVALGSSFLCGAFVPMEWLPDGVLKAAHIFPSYYFVKNNEIVKTMEVFNSNTLKPIIINMVVVIAFSALFIVLSNIVAGRKRKLA